VSRFSRRHPKVKITLHQTTPSEITELLHRGEADIGFTSDPKRSKDIVNLPCLNLERTVVVPSGHPLLDLRRVTLKSLTEYPLITYESSYRTREIILKTFEKYGLNPSIVLSVSDADVIKTCVEKGIGIGVLLEVAYNAQRDQGISNLSATTLFPAAKVCIMLNRNHPVRMHAYDFIEEVSGKWNRSNVQRAVSEKKK
ncbi:MAG: transcriptional regulator, partial [Burkholderiales bacterium]|nr:transcriptional regulator [Burkholderiales bacterium]